jgi:hypothetical protein
MNDVKIIRKKNNKKFDIAIQNKEEKKGNAQVLLPSKYPTVVELRTCSSPGISRVAFV